MAKFYKNCGTFANLFSANRAYAYCPPFFNKFLKKWLVLIDFLPT